MANIFLPSVPLGVCSRGAAVTMVVLDTVILGMPYENDCVIYSGVLYLAQEMYLYLYKVFHQ